MRISDWSSDVCSSDLVDRLGEAFVGPEDQRKRVLEDEGHLFRQIGDRCVGGQAQREVRHDVAQMVAAARDLRLAAAVVIGGTDAQADPWVAGQRTQVTHDGRRPEGATELRKRSEEHTSELQSLMRISYAVFCLK